MNKIETLNALAASLVLRDARTLAAALHVISEMTAALLGRDMTRDETYRVAQMWRLTKSPSAVPGVVYELVEDAGPVPVNVWHSCRMADAPPAPERG